RPVDVPEVELAVRALPEKEPGQAHLAARPNDEIRVGQIGRVEVPGERLLRDALDDRLEVLPLLGLCLEHGVHRVDNLLAPAVGDGDRQHRPAVGCRGVLGLADRGDDRVREEIELADGADPHAEAVGPRMARELDELGLDRLQNAGDFTRVPAKVLRREDPEAHRGDRQLAAPEEHVVELPRAERVGLERVDEPALDRVAAVAVEDDTDVPGNGAPPDLPKEAPLVEVVEGRDHQPFERRLPPTPAVILGKNRGVGYILPRESRDSSRPARFARRIGDATRGPEGRGPRPRRQGRGRAARRPALLGGASRWPPAPSAALTYARGRPWRLWARGRSGSSPCRWRAVTGRASSSSVAAGGASPLPRTSAPRRRTPSVEGRSRPRRAPSRGARAWTASSRRRAPRRP